MTENGLIIREMVKELLHGKMEINILDYGKIIIGMEKENLYPKKVMYMKVNGWMIKEMDMVLKFMKMEINI